MNIVLQVALNTFKETIRNKILYNILIVAGIVLLLSFSFGDLSVFSRVQVMTDFGLATLSLTGLLLSIFIGVGMLGMEISNKTVYGILTKPVDRGQFIIGKFFGLFTTLLLNFALIAVLFLGAIRFIGGAVQTSLISAVILIAVEMALIIAASIFFSAFTTPLLAAIFTIAFYAAGHLNDLISVSAVNQTNPFFASLLSALYYLLPNLEHFNIRSLIIYNLPVPHDFLLLAMCYGVLYAALMLMLSIGIFAKKDL